MYDPKVYFEISLIYELKVQVKILSSTQGA